MRAIMKKVSRTSCCIVRNLILQAARHISTASSNSHEAACFRTMARYLIPYKTNNVKDSLQVESESEDYSKIWPEDLRKLSTSWVGI